ncbi:MAG: hypothetical protein U0798_07610 [Gemmataceae bacterium]
MMFRKWFHVTRLGMVALTGLVALGCGKSTSTTSTEPKHAHNAKNEHDADHEHPPGAHGGTLVSLGLDSYHAEVVFEKGGVIHLYMLGKDEARVQEVESQDLTAFVTASGSTESEKMTFRAEPQSGDSKGKTSLFSASLPKDLIGKTAQVTINNINVNGERFRISFSNKKHDAHDAKDAHDSKVEKHEKNHDDGHDANDPTKKKSKDEEQTLFMTPGGLYTTKDITANGNTIPAVKYKGIRAKHDDSPKVGDKICPISKTKANPQFTWAIGGKTYEFCCIPCIEEFVVLAKEKPGEVKDPKDYVKK